MTKTQRPIVVVLDGIDGSGKTTLAHRLVAKLRELQRCAMFFRDPGGTPTGEQIRGLVKSAEVPMHPNTQFLLFCAARAELAADINKLLVSGCDVVLDRWWYSTFAYQGASGIDEAAILDVSEKFAHLDFPHALDDMDNLEGGALAAYHLHVTPKTSRERLRRPDRETDVVKDRYETKGAGFLDNVYARYLELEARGYLRRVETEGRSLDDVYHRLVNLVDERIARHG